MLMNLPCDYSKSIDMVKRSLVIVTAVRLAVDQDKEAGDLTVECVRTLKALMDRLGAGRQEAIAEKNKGKSPAQIKASQLFTAAIKNEGYKKAEKRRDSEAEIAPDLESKIRMEMATAGDNVSPFHEADPAPVIKATKQTIADEP